MAYDIYGNEYTECVTFYFVIGTSKLPLLGLLRNITATDGRVTQTFYEEHYTEDKGVCQLQKESAMHGNFYDIDKIVVTSDDGTFELISSKYDSTDGYTQYYKFTPNSDTKVLDMQTFTVDTSTTFTVTYNGYDYTWEKGVINTETDYLLYLPSDASTVGLYVSYGLIKQDDETVNNVTFSKSVTTQTITFSGSGSMAKYTGDTSKKVTKSLKFTMRLVPHTDDNGNIVRKPTQKAVLLKTYGITYTT